MNKNERKQQWCHFLNNYKIATAFMLMKNSIVSKLQLKHRVSSGNLIQWYHLWKSSHYLYEMVAGKSREGNKQKRGRDRQREQIKGGRDRQREQIKGGRDRQREQIKGGRDRA
jgi:hypothetical protein